jgi:hypothetical protein
VIVRPVTSSFYQAAFSSSVFSGTTTAAALIGRIVKYQTAFASVCITVAQKDIWEPLKIPLLRSIFINSNSTWKRVFRGSFYSIIYINHE